MEEFKTVTIEDFNNLFSISLNKDMAFWEACDLIEDEGIKYWYMSMCAEDVLGDLEENKEFFITHDVSLYYIKDICIYISTYN